MARVVFPLKALQPLIFADMPVNDGVDAIRNGIADDNDGDPKDKFHDARGLLALSGWGSGRRLLALMFAQRKAAQVFRAGRHVLFMAAQIIDHFKPCRINAQFQPAFLLRLFRAHGQLRYVVFDGNVRLHGSGVNRPQSSYPESSYTAYLTEMYGKSYYQGINNTGAPMDFLFSPLAGLVTSLILSPGPILPDVSGLFAAGAPPAVEQRVSVPTPSGDTRFDLMDSRQFSGPESEIRPAVSNPFTGR